MKHIITAFCLCMIATITNAQTASLQQLLTDYYSLKNALVKDDANAASASADKLLADTKSLDIATLNATEQKTFSSEKEAITHNAEHISEVTSIVHQREHFAVLSNAMATLVQSTNISGKPVYVDYCPMKKTYWLSSDTTIRNPYFGSAMLTCGEVAKTIK